MPNETLLTEKDKLELIVGNPLLDLSMEDDYREEVKALLEAQNSKTSAHYEKRIAELKEESEARREVLMRMTAKCEAVVKAASEARADALGEVIGWMRKNSSESLTKAGLFQVVVTTEELLKQLKKWGIDRADAETR